MAALRIFSLKEMEHSCIIDLKLNFALFASCLYWTYPYILENNNQSYVSPQWMPYKICYEPVVISFSFYPLLRTKFLCLFIPKSPEISWCPLHNLSSPTKNYGITSNLFPEMANSCIITLIFISLSLLFVWAFWVYRSSHASFI